MEFILFLIQLTVLKVDYEQVANLQTDIFIIRGLLLIGSPSLIAYWLLQKNDFSFLYVVQAQAYIMTLAEM